MGLRFTSNSDYLTGPGLSTSGTVVCWFKVDALPAVNGYQSPWSIDNNTSSWIQPFFWNNAGANQIGQGFAHTGGDVTLLSGPSAGTWYFLASLVTLGGNSVCYIGTAGGTLTKVTDSIGLTPGSMPSANIVLGNEVAADQMLNGDLAGVIIYSRLLTDAEVRQQFTQLGPVSTNGLLAYLPFTTSANPGTNRMGSSGNFTVTGSPGFAATLPPIPEFPPAGAAPGRPARNLSGGLATLLPGVPTISGSPSYPNPLPVFGAGFLVASAAPSLNAYTLTADPATVAVTVTDAPVYPTTTPELPAPIFRPAAREGLLPLFVAAPPLFGQGFLVAGPTANAYALTAAQSTVTLTAPTAGLIAARVLGLAQGSVALSSSATALRVGRTLVAAQGAVSVTAAGTALLAGRRLTATQASVAVSGQTTGLLSGRRLTAAQASVAVTGTTTGLARTRAIQAAQASVSVTTQATGLVAAHRLSAAQASVTVTAPAASLVYQPLGSYTLAATTRTISVTGQATSLLAGRRLAATQSTIAVSGQPAALPVGRRLTAAQATVTVTGPTTALRRAARIAAAQAAATITAPAVSLVYQPHGAYTLAATTSSSSVTGQLVSLLAGRRLVAAQYSASVTASAVTFPRGRALAVSAGLVSATAQPVALRAARRLLLAQGSVTVSAQAAALAKGRGIAATAASLSLTGSPVALRTSRVLIAGIGTVTVTAYAVDLGSRRVVGDLLVEIVPTHDLTLDVIQRFTATIGVEFVRPLQPHDKPRIWLTFTDLETGSLYDPDVVSAKVRKPDGTIVDVSVQVARAAVGKYSVDYEVTDSGPWAFWGLGTGPNGASAADEKQVVVARSKFP
jgi:hypothetical protein